MTCSEEPWVIFDADNTLWHVEPLYDAARDALAKLLCRYGIPENLVHRQQRSADVALHSRFGYSPERFETSFVHTIHKLLPDHADELEDQVRALARSVFTSNVVTDSAVPQVLDALRHKFKLALLTAGDPKIQERRLAEFPHAHIFDEILIVPQKTEEVFESLCDKNHIARSLSYVVGDSLRSDIIPALRAGLNAIWLQSHNWHEVESGTLNAPPSVPRITQLAELVDILGIPRGR